MENASKALLIAAGVLIVILLIAFGMQVFNSTGDTSEDAKETGNAIKSSTLDAKVKAILSLIDIENDKSFYNYINDNYTGNSVSADDVRVLCNLVSIRSQRLDGTEQSYTRIYISGWQNEENVITWGGDLDKTLEKIKDNKKYSVELSKRGDNGENAYSVRIIEK